LNARLRGIFALELSRAGLHDEALAEYARARELDPMNPNLLGTGPGVPMGAEIHMRRGRPDEAVQELVRVAALRGATSEELVALRTAMANGDMRAVWRQWLVTDLRMSKGAVNSMRRGQLEGLAGDTERAVDWFERAHAERIPGFIFVQVWEDVIPGLRTHPRYRRILADMRLPAR